MENTTKLLQLIECSNRCMSRVVEDYSASPLANSMSGDFHLRSFGGHSWPPSKMLRVFYEFSDGQIGADRLMRWFSVNEVAAATQQELFLSWLEEDIENDFAAPAGIDLNRVCMFGFEKDDGDFRIYLIFDENDSEPRLVKYGHEIQEFLNLDAYLLHVLSVNLSAIESNL